MAVDVCAEIPSPGIISPRISFSHDLNTNNNNQTPEISEDCPRLDSCLLDSDFDFFIGGGGTNFQQELSSADELFSNGTILPVQFQKQKESHYHPPTGKKAIPLPPPPPPPPQPAREDSDKKDVPKLLKEFLSMSLDGDEDDQSQTPAPTVSKSVWPQFKRSNSLNSIRSRGGDLIRSLHFLSRSHSTGSAPIPSSNKSVPPPSSKEKPHLRKQRSVPCSRKSPFYPYNLTNNNAAGQQKSTRPHLRKCGSYGNNNNCGVRISPVLNIPSPTFISRGTVNIFGSLFCNGKVKKKKKKR